MKKSFAPTAALLFCAVAFAGLNAHADCLPKYQAAMEAQQSVMSHAEKGDNNAYGMTNPFGFTTLGIPNMTATSDYISAKSKQEALLEVVHVLKEAEAGNGIHLIELRNEIRKAGKGTESLEVELLGDTIREANKRHYFCASTVLADYKAMKIILINMLAL